MKNVKKYIILAIFLSFAFMGGIKAATNYNVKEVNLPHGDVAYFDLSNYNGLSCDVTSPKSFTKMSYSGTSYKVEWIDSNSTKNGTEIYNCTFTSIDGVSPQPASKALNIKVHYGKKTTRTTVIIQLVKNKIDSRNLVRDEYASNTNYLPGVKKITSVSQNKGGKYASGAQYVTLNCPVGGSSCGANLSSSLPTDTSKRWAQFTVKYTDTNGNGRETIFDFEITGKTMLMAYTGAYGTCDFDSKWEKESSSVYKIQSVSGTVNLPVCNTEFSANPLIEFVGWSNHSTYAESGKDYQALDKCVTYATTTPGDYVPDPDKTIYIACYKTAGGIILQPNGGTLNKQSNYIYKDDVIYVKKDGSITLPEPTKIPKLYDMYGTGRFEGWMDSKGNIHAAGKSVAADGERYMAKYSMGQTVDGTEVNQKMIYVGEVEPYTLNSTTISQCTSADTTKLSAYMSGGQCFLKGIAETGSNYIDVAIKTQSSTRTLKVRVVSREGEFGDDWDNIIIDGGDNSNADAQDGYYENVSGANVCNTYAVSNAGSLTSSAASYNGFNLGVSKYNAKSKCNDNKNYLALCMDPGRPGPNTSDIYEIDNSFTRTNDFGKLVSHIVQKFVNETETNSNIIAANIALRIVEYYSIEELASSNNGGNWYLASALSAYQVVGADLKAACPDLTNCTYNKAYNALGAHWTWNSNDIRSQVATYLTGYTGVVTDDDRDIKNETKRSSSFTTGNEFLYKITYEGKLTFPTGMNVQPSDISHNCGNIAGVRNCNLTGSFSGTDVYNYKFTYEIDLSNRNFKIPKFDSKDNPSIKVNARSGVTSSNVFVIKTINDNKQRMVIFNTEPVDLTVLMPIYVVCDIEKAPFKIGASGFREDLFKTAGCCQFITDETSSEFLTYCTADCINTNFATMCNPNETVGNNADTDVYSINESYRATAGGTKELNYACIVDVSGGSTAISNTNNKKDEVGNYYALMAYNSNQYCSISCKEDWDISTASFSNFIGEGAKAAGQTFSLKPDMFIGGSRTCVTTYIDYDKYIDEQTQLSKELVEAWNTQSEYSKVYSVLKASATTTTQTYYTYTHNGGYQCDPRPCGTEENPQTCYDTCYDWTQHVHTCQVSSVSTSSGGNFDKASWQTYNTTYNTGGYATSSSGSISTNKLSHSSGSSSISYYGGVTGNVEIRDSGKKLETEYYSGSSSAPGRKNGSNYYYNGKCNTNHTVDYLIDGAKYKGYDVDSTVTNNRATVNTKRNAIYDKATDMTACQNFKLKNTSTERKNSFNYDSTSNTDKTYYGYSSITGFMGATTVPVIDTKFEPSGSYDYEEREFMTMVGKDNVIVTYDEKNQEYLSKAGKNAATFNNDCVTITDRKNSNGQNIKLCKNKLETNIYTSSSAWNPNSVAGKTYGSNLANNSLGTEDLASKKITLCKFSGSDPSYDNRGSCDYANGYIYYYKANYMKQTLSNSSFYRNKGSWYLNNANDSKVHADNFATAVNKFNVGEEHIDLLGDAINTFPISVTTPRNIYQYSYTFGDIGYFSDGTTGRIMGNASTSLIAVNRHACFYEVYEDICRCCGDPMLWTTYESSKTQETGRFLDEKNVDYTMSLDTYDPNMVFNSHLGYVNSTVSLYDLDGTSGGTLPGNWGTSDKFTYQSEIYTTGKGQYLANEIIKKGETIYTTQNNSPEYSYTLNPSALSLIREYNGSHKYGYSTNDLIAYGISKKKTPLNFAITDINGKENTVNTFSHYGSRFLEEYMSDYVTAEFAASVLTARKNQGPSTVCYVEEGADAASKAYALVQTQKCRWVDYVETTDTGSKVRLAFK